MPYQTVIYEKEADLGLLTLNRPERLNAFNSQLVTDMDAVLDEVSRDSAVRVLIITGKGRAFSAGADISELEGLDTGPKVYSWLQRIQELYNRIEALEKPSIAAVNGFALGGGCELAIACDLRIAAEGASFGVPEISIGALPGGGGTQRLPRLVSPTIAKQMVLTGEALSAQEAYRIGLVNKVVPAGELLAEARALSRKLSSKPPLSVKMAKIAIDTGLALDLKAGLELERQCVTFLFGTQDRKEGMRAFLEKRPATFKGH